ncbi:SDR family NAD(P)-dependent oxidoreductase [Curvivirga aplysinae]|uniref:SDR family NAD(P)-dependent oxidoreductase n=1 Tax=Curvivirga aplysinae TaxID=2529852 RepID=UPI0012BCB752|nr:SDR family oxidoreductase [Curvivirga aplysinae]MTI08304.1 SDR family oxidoreductase [Curvivirga aplysinae]
MNQKRNIIITGASSGIGAAIAKTLTDDGDHVYACARRQDRLEDLKDYGVKFVHPCDVCDEESVKSFFAEVSKLSNNIDGLIHCAGSFGSIGPMVNSQSEEWWGSLKTNIFGTYLFVKNVVPLMRAERHPVIITFAGGGAFNAFENYSAYAVSKSGIVRLTETLAEELSGQGICINAVAPGFVATEIHNETLEKGINYSGESHYSETLKKLKEGSVPISVPVDLVKFLLSSKALGLTGKTISASFDPWNNENFMDNINELNASDLYTMRRMNLINLTEEDEMLKKTLSTEM